MNSVCISEEVCRLRDTVKSQQEEMKVTEASTDNAHVTSPTCRPKQRLLVVGGVTNEKIGTGQREYNHCHYWMEESNCWQLLTELPQSVGRWYDICQLASDQLLLTGGVKGGVVKGDCWLLDGNKWTQMPSLASARYLHRSVLLGDYVYVVGGEDVSGKVIASVERFDLKQHQWSLVPDMPQSVYNPCVISYDHRVFVFGGRNANFEVLSCTQVYDTTLDKWLTLAAMSEACDSGAAVSINRCIYLVGGHSRSCLRYDPATDSWTRLSRPHQEHSQAPAVMWQGGILVAGGGGNTPLSAIIEHYDPVFDEWSDWQTPLKEKLTCHGMFSVIHSGV
ncbi:hypothetical protein LSAT2_019394 [Lamellibrachia satsuma]|nr:hypothetical protein LSAT2_019394 [Lamellibrachia satsuma]